MVIKKIRIVNIEKRFKRSKTFKYPDHDYYLTRDPPPPYKETRDPYQKIGDWYYVIQLAMLAPIVGLSMINFSFDIWHIVVWSILAIPTVITIFNAIGSSAIRLMILAFEMSIADSMEKYMRLAQGTPGAGKSSLTISIAILIARIKWHMIQFKWWLIKKRYKKIINGKDIIKKQEAIEIKESYEYFSTPKFNTKTKQWYWVYPLLMTTIPVVVNGVRSTRLTIKQLLQGDKIPYGAVIHTEEIGLSLPPSLSKDPPRPLLETAKFIRQYFWAHLLMTEQNGSFVVKAFRDCTSEARFVLNQKWIFRPRLLLKIIDKLTDYFVKQDKPTPFKVKLMETLIRISKNVGGRKYTYQNFDTGVLGTRERKKTCVLPTYLYGYYDDRAFRNGYRAKDKPLNCKGWETLVLQKEQLHEIFPTDREVRDILEEIENAA